MPALVGGGLLASQARWTGSATTGGQDTASAHSAYPALDARAVATVEQISLAQAVAKIATGAGLSPTPTISHPITGGRTFTIAGSSAMVLTPETAVTLMRDAQGKATGGQVALRATDAPGAVMTSVVDPVANFMAATGGTRAEAVKFFGGDPLADSGAVLPNGTVLAPTSMHPNSADGPLLASSCYDMPVGAYYHDHGCFVAYLDDGTITGTTPWLVVEKFVSSFSMDGWWRYPTYAGLWMDHAPSPMNSIVDWSPASDQASGLGCATASIGLSFGVSIGASWPICDGNIGPDGPMIFTANGRTGWTYGPRWKQHGWAVSGRVYELRGMSLVHTSRATWAGKTFAVNLKWAG